jgi:hypothetical protein
MGRSNKNKPKPPTQGTKPQSSLQLAVSKSTTRYRGQGRGKTTKNRLEQSLDSSNMSESLVSEDRSMDTNPVATPDDDSFISNSPERMILDKSLNMSVITELKPEEEITFTPADTGSVGSVERVNKGDEPGEDWLKTNKTTHFSQSTEESTPVDQGSVAPHLAQTPNSDLQSTTYFSPKGKSYSEAVRSPARPAPVVQKPTVTNPYWKEPLKKLPHRANMIRFDLRRILVPASDQALDTLLEALSTFVLKLRQVDVTAIIYPWSVKHFGVRKEITDPRRTFPTDFQSLREYFHNFVPLPKGGETFGQIFLGFSIEFRSLIEALSWQYESKTERPTLWQMPLQRENTTKIGWLLYSLPSMDKNLLTHAIFEKTGVQVGLRWQMISLGKSGKLEEHQKVRALHVELDSATADKGDTSKIKKLYASSTRKQAQDEYPLGVHFRLVPMINDLFQPEARSSVECLRNRQSSFIKFCQTSETWDLQGLDTPSVSLAGYTLREAIMLIPVHPYEYNKKLFLSIDKHWDKDSVKLTFLPQHEDIARNIVASLLTVLRYYLQEAVDEKDYPGMTKFFTPAAVTRAEQCSFDPETGVVTSNTDNYTNTLLGLDAEWDLTGMEEAHTEAQKVEITNAPSMTRPKRTVHLPTDHDSIKTFGTEAFPTQQVVTHNDNFSISTQSEECQAWMLQMYQGFQQQQLLSSTTIPPGGSGPG